MPGRNDQCPCGSGQKYKRCCLAKDRDAKDAQIKVDQLEREAKATPVVLAPVDQTSNLLPSSPKPVATPALKTVVEPPTDPHMEAIYARWSEFEDADADLQPALFLKTLDEPALMDDEMAYGMLSAIYFNGPKSAEPNRIEEFVGLLRERLPDVYAASRKYYLHWLILNANASQKSERLLELAGEIAETAGEDIDIFSKVVHLLAYHGHLEALSKASRIAWPLIKVSKDIMWGQQEYAVWGAKCVLYERLERTPDVDGSDPQLIEQTMYFLDDLQLDWLKGYVDQTSGRARRHWSLSDFDIKPTKKTKAKRTESRDTRQATNQTTGEDALIELSYEFVGDAHAHDGYSYTKAELARQNIVSYLIDRKAGRLETKESAKNKLQFPDHPLCPDRDTLKRFLTGMLSMLNYQNYDVVATMELLPSWLRFLETRGLIEPTQRESTMSDIGSLHAELLGAFGPSDGDPVLAENFRKWPGNAARHAAQKA
jgi:hypothetical protein